VIAEWYGGYEWGGHEYQERSLQNTLLVSEQKANQV
jgi:hypothetical protein